MLKTACSVTKLCGISRRLYSSSKSGDARSIDTITGSYDTIAIDEFRQRAFVPELPLLIARGDTRLADAKSNSGGLPAASKWFHLRVDKEIESIASGDRIISHRFLSKYGDTNLPYELVIDTRDDNVQSWIREHGSKPANVGLVGVLSQLLDVSGGLSFHRFDAPLSIFLEACKYHSPTFQRLYIAQAQISDLPMELQADLPTPRLVKEAGKGDVYDSNIWMGLPPTYTPLHKDPNPNLFIQLASSKTIRLFQPSVGALIFRHVQQQIGQQASASFRGNEMMEGPERDALDHAVWGTSIDGVFETTVSPGDALFIPKGWWHSIKSVGSGITASANWWFR